MIGILINHGEIDFYSKNFFKIFQYIVDFKDKSIIIFTLDNLNLKSQTVYGKLITIDTINFTKSQIPNIIYNLSYKNTNSDKKKIRFLAECKNTILLNEVNEFNQNMIVDILVSNKNTKKYVFNKNMFNKKSFYYKPLKKDNILILPKDGINSFKTLKIKKVCDNKYYLSENSNNSELYQLIFDNGNKYLFSNKKWSIASKLPPLLTSFEDPTIITAYMQRDAYGKWHHILKTDYLTKKIEIPSIEITNCVSSFISNLWFCTINFIIDEKYNPYLINFKGFDKNLLTLTNNHQLQNRFINNVFNYTDHMIQNQKEVAYFVD